MLLSLNWLSDFIDISHIDAERLADVLTNTGTAVEGIKRTGSELKDMIAARVLEVEEHPNADRLRIAVIDNGKEELRVVCGAPNLAKGMITVFAGPGVGLPGGSKVKTSNIRGVLSPGMLLSAYEMGLSDDSSGIVELERHIEPGISIEKVNGFADTILELEITPNRPDCMSVMGMASEISAITGSALFGGNTANQDLAGGSESFDIAIDDACICPRYSAVIVRNITVGQSPLRIQLRLKAAGMRPINNVVDITNYVMIETGQPLHAFDIDKLRGGAIGVRLAKSGEQMRTLDGVMRRLETEDIVITDGEGIVAIAGVMGGEETEVSERTRGILIESAHFRAPCIMATSRRLDLVSEASRRFERGTDPSGTISAAMKSANLMRDYASGVISSGIIDAYPKNVDRKLIPFSSRTCRDILGVEIEDSEINGIFDSLGFECEKSSDETITVSVPTCRPDLERSIDLVEEVARIYGYKKIPETTPLGRSRGMLSDAQKKREELRGVLCSAGLVEVITQSFVSAESKTFSWFTGDDEVLLDNPVSEEMSVMRGSLLQGLMKTLEHNNGRGNNDISIFEIGRVFRKKGTGFPEEVEMAGVAMTGRTGTTELYREGSGIDFFDIKGVFEALTEQFKIEGLEINKCSYDFMHPERSVVIMRDKKIIGIMGEIHPRTSASYGISGRVAILEICTNDIYELIPESVKVNEISRFPHVKVDAAFIVDGATESEDLMKVFIQTNGDSLKKVEVFDVYSGKGIPEGKKSIAFRMIFASQTRTLTDEDVNTMLASSARAVESAFGAQLRGELL